MRELTEPRKGYGGAGETQQAKAAVIESIVSAQSVLYSRAMEKTNLNDVEAVKAVAASCMDTCGKLGVLPNFEALAAALGYSRRGLYKYLECHPDTPTSEFLDCIRTAWAGLRIMAADRQAVDPTTSIFVLLNSSLDFSNQHNVLIETPANPLDGVNTDTAAARERLLSALPDITDGD